MTAAQWRTTRWALRTGVDLRIADSEGRAITGPGEGVLQMRTPALMPSLSLATTQSRIRG